MTKIKTIRDGAGVHTLGRNADVPSLSLKLSENIRVSGQVKSQDGVAVTCTVSRHFKDNEDKAWATTLFCTAGNDGWWDLDIGTLPEGRYMLTVSGSEEEADYAEINVSHPHGRVAVYLTTTDAKSDHITVNGTTIFTTTANVVCTLSPITSSGAPRPNPPNMPNTRTVLVAAKRWSVSFYPTDVNATTPPPVFQGNYSFEAYAPAEGTASEQIVV
jgi:hypothetical protein